MGAEVGPLVVIGAVLVPVTFFVMSYIAEPSYVTHYNPEQSSLSIPFATSPWSLTELSGVYGGITMVGTVEIVMTRT